MDVQEADAQLAQLGQRGDDLARDEVEAAAPRLEVDLALGPDRGGYRSPGVLTGYSETGTERSSAVRRMRVCSVVCAAG